MVFVGGGWNGNKLDRIDYITISSTGNAIDFGNLLASGYGAASCSNNTNDRAVFAGLNPDGTYLQYYRVYNYNIYR